MAELVTTADVTARLGRPLNADETDSDLVETLIGDAENMVRVRLPGRVLDPGTIDVGSVKQVVANAVARVLRNPDGYRSESAGGVSYTIDTRAAAGFLTILADEWLLLGLSAPSGNRAGSFAPVLGTAYPSGRWSPWL